jgi:hypothetical protein
MNVQLQGTVLEYGNVVLRSKIGEPGPTCGHIDTANMLSAAENPAQESRRLIDEKIANFEECIRRLKSQRNELAPISQLPPEILSSIFSYAAAQSGFDSNRPLVRYFFTHVSRAWRSVALDSPTLWRILPSSIPWANAMLDRSKAVGLVIRLRIPYSSPTSPLVLFWKGVFCNHASRIRELDLAETSRSTLPVLFGDLQPSSLPLHSLQLYHSAQLDPTFPTAVLETKHLRSLSVTGYGGAWYSLPLPCLTELKLHDIPSRPHLDEFIETLRGNPHLQDLDMKDSLPLASEPNRSIVSVDLPRLRSLRLSSTRNPKEVSNILACIIVPPTAILELNCRNRDSLEDDQVTLIDLASSLSVFFSAMSKSAGISYDEVHVHDEGSLIHLSAWETGNLDIRSQKPKMDLRIAPRMYRSPQQTLREIFPSLPLLKIKSLTLGLDAANIVVTEILCNLSCLQSVTLVGNCTFDFITALMDSPQHDYNQDSFYSVTFPALQTLCITGTSCGPEGDCPIEYIRDCLIERYERKAQLTKLKIAVCYDVYSNDVDLLKEIVVDVEWDGLEMEAARSEDDVSGVGDYADFGMDDDFGIDIDFDMDDWDFAVSP